MRPMRVWIALGWLLASAALRAQTEAPDADWRYRIQPGDTLITLTENWLAAPRSWRDLQKLNRVPDPLRLVPGSTLRMPVAWLRREAGVAETLFVRGQVTRQRGSAAEPLSAGAPLQSGDRIRTGAQSSASLRFADGSRLLIPADSDVTLDQLLVLGRNAIPAVRIGVQQGGADSRVTPNAQRVPLYEVRTPHVNLGVRGTEFRVQAAGAQSRMQVLSGAVHADGLLLYPLGALPHAEQFEELRREVGVLLPNLLADSGIDLFQDLGRGDRQHEAALPEHHAGRDQRRLPR